MEGGPFLTDEFVSFSKGCVLFLHVTSRIEGRENDELFFDLDCSEFPTLLVLDAEGDILARHAGEFTVPAFRALGDKVTRFRDLKKKADAGDTTVGIDLAILACDLGQTEFDELEEAIEGRELSEAQRRAVGTLRANAATAEMAMILRAGRYDGSSLSMAADEFAGLEKKGFAPDRTTERRLFWTVIAAHAGAAGDAALSEKALKEVTAAGGSAKAVETFQDRIAKHRAADAGK